MRFEIILFIVVACIIANIYTDGRFLKKMLSYKKYYQMGGIVVGAFVLLWLIRKNPLRANQIISTTNEYIKYMPIDSGTASMLSPILDFTSKHSFSDTSTSNAIFDRGGDIDNPILAMPVQMTQRQSSEHRLTQSGGTNLKNMVANGQKATKRSVSETKKKFVASRQNWKCGHCDKQLTAWFEVDHKMRLEYGGSNHIDNLVALCRECHGEKTTMENL